MIVSEESTETKPFVVENIVLGCNAEVMPTQIQCYIREVFTGTAVDGVDPMGVSCGTHLFISARYQSRGRQKKG